MAISVGCEAADCFAEFILSGDSSVDSLPQNDKNERLRFFDKLRMSGTKG